MGLSPASDDLVPEDDPLCLGQLKHYRSLMPLALEARKAIFQLTPADGAIGAHYAAVKDCAQDFRRLALQLIEAIGGESTASDR